MLRSLHERGEIELAKIRSHCSRRRAWFSSPVLGWLNYRQPIWHQISLWDFCDQYHSLPDHWLFIGFPGEACRAQRRVEVPNSDRLCWSLQYILDLRMGDLFQFADGCLLRGCPLRCFELLPWPGSCMVWSLDREAFLMRAHKVLNYESILQVLGEGGCPFCRFMKNFQTALLQEPKGEVRSSVQLPYLGTCCDPAGRVSCRTLYVSSSGTIWSGSRFLLHHLHLTARGRRSSNP